MSAINPGSDLYRGLGVAPDASTEQIARAYRRLARRYHPDISATTDAAEDFARITHAYRVLSDPPARARYDATRTARTRTTDTGEGRAAPTGRRSPWTRAWPSAAAATSEALWLGGPTFSRAFHVGAHAQGAVSTEPGCELEVSLEEAYLGTSRIVTVSGPTYTRTVQVTVPPGVLTGQQLRVPLSHLPGGHEIAPVNLTVRLAPHDRYRVDGRDVHLALALAPWEAALGTTITHDGPAGPVSIRVPAGTSGGALLRVLGQGLPNPTGPAGDLCARVSIVVPARLTPAERRLFTRLAAVSTFDPRGTGPEEA